MKTWSVVPRPMMLAMVPVSDVPDVFATIADSIPDTLDLDSFIGYFKRTWISGVSSRRARFPPRTWNKTERVEIGMGRTNNFLQQDLLW